MVKRKARSNKSKRKRAHYVDGVQPKKVLNCPGISYIKSRKSNNYLATCKALQGDLHFTERGSAHLGYYATEEEAVRARDKAILGKYGGPNASTYFPKSDYDMEALTKEYLESKRRLAVSLVQADGAKLTKKIGEGNIFTAVAARQSTSSGFDVLIFLGKTSFKCGICKRKRGAKKIAKDYIEKHFESIKSSIEEARSAAIKHWKEHMCKETYAALLFTHQIGSMKQFKGTALDLGKKGAGLLDYKEQKYNKKILLAQEAGEPEPVFEKKRSEKVGTKLKQESKAAEKEGVEASELPGSVPETCDIPQKSSGESPQHEEEAEPAQEHPLMWEETNSNANASFVVQDQEKPAAAMEENEDTEFFVEEEEEHAESEDGGEGDIGDVDEDIAEEEENEEDEESDEEDVEMVLDSDSDGKIDEDDPELAMQNFVQPRMHPQQSAFAGLGLSEYEIHMLICQGAFNPNPAPPVNQADEFNEDDRKVESDEELEDKVVPKEMQLGEAAV